MTTWSFCWPCLQQFFQCFPSYSEGLAHKTQTTPRSVGLRVAGWHRHSCLCSSISSHATLQTNLRVPHPWFVRVGSYDATSQIFRSSLLSSVNSVAPL